MAILRAQCNLRSDSLVAMDDIINVFHFTTVDATTPAAGAAAAVVMLKNFYAGIGSFWSSSLTNVDGTIKVYDLADAVPRAPILEDQALDITTGANTLPREVCLTMSFQGVKASGIPQARRRGRVYLGPWVSTAADTGSGRPGVGLLGAVQAAGAALLAASEASAAVRWVVYSPTSGDVAIVDNGWVDNEWDTQRRRGFQSTARSVF